MTKEAFHSEGKTNPLYHKLSFNSRSLQPTIKCINRAWVRNIRGVLTVQVVVEYLRLGEVLEAVVLRPQADDRFCWRLFSVLGLQGNVRWFLDAEGCKGVMEDQCTSKG